MHSARCFLAALLAIAYVFLIEAIANFITRDLPKFKEALWVKEEQAFEGGDQSYRAYLLHQPVENLLDIVSPDSDASLPTDVEVMYVEKEIAVLEDILSDNPGLSDTFMGGGKIDMKNTIFDNMYKRILIDVIMQRAFPEPLQTWSDGDAESPARLL